MRDLDDLQRLRGWLPLVVAPDPNSPPTPLVREPGGRKASQAEERLRRLEDENAILKAEVGELKRALEKYTVLSEALALSGRVPR